MERGNVTLVEARKDFVNDNKEKMTMAEQTNNINKSM